MLCRAQDAPRRSASAQMGGGGRFPIQLLHEMNPQHHLHRKRRPATSAVGHERADQHHQFRPRHHGVHLFEERPPARALARLTQSQTRLLHAPHSLSRSACPVADLPWGYADFPKHRGVFREPAQGVESVYRAQSSFAWSSFSWPEPFSSGRQRRIQPFRVFRAV